MRFSRNFFNVTLADFLVRSAYQMGKTPLLPLFAAALGTSDALLGFIVAVSTLTGMVTKPLFGVLSDRQGRRLWLLLGTAFFATIPFLYRFIHTPEQLVLIRIVHGTATAIYGPVTLAYVAEQSGRRKAESLGWFGMARSGGYIVGPAAAGWLLLWLDPVAVFTAIGLISLTAFVPILLLTEGKRIRDRGSGIGDQDASLATRPSPLAPRPPSLRRSAVHNVSTALRTGARVPAVWLSGGLEAITYVATYAIKAFLPIYALTAGYNTAEIGLFFSVQEGVHLVLKPAGGRFGDRLGQLLAIALGMGLIGVALPLLTVAQSFVGLMAIAALMGLAQALIVPCTVALVSEQIDDAHVATGMGLVGTLKNGGKVIGPALGGLLVAGLGYSGMLWLMGLLLLVSAGFLSFVQGARRERRLPLSVPESLGD